MFQLTVNLPEELAERAEAAGVLNEAKVVSLISAEVERQAKMERLFDTMKQLQRVNTLSQAEIDAEIEAARIEQRNNYD